MFQGEPIKHFKAIHTAQFDNQRKIIEALEIKKRKPIICKQKDKLFELKIPWQ